MFKKEDGPVNPGGRWKPSNLIGSTRIDDWTEGDVISFRPGWYFFCGVLGE
jgi:hypothetical protein